MYFLNYDLNVDAGDVVIVKLSRAANVRLLDPINFNRLKRGLRHEYIGGLARVSPMRLPVPHDGHWHVVVDLGGYRGSVNASVSVIRG